MRRGYDDDVEAHRAAGAIRSDPARQYRFWDIGMDDENCIWFHQTDGVRHSLIDF